VKRLDQIRARVEAATKGPWNVWPGPEYVGGGEDMCIGAGEQWLANMDHRVPRCPQIMDDGHPDDDQCDICSLDSPRISKEQDANAEFIAHARADVPWLLDRIAELEGALRAAEWGGMEWSYSDEAVYYCPCCGKLENEGHAADCTLAKALSGVSE
jgi:hypothetical protein